MSGMQQRAACSKERHAAGSAADLLAMVGSLYCIAQVFIPNAVLVT